MLTRLKCVRAFTLYDLIVFLDGLKAELASPLPPNVKLVVVDSFASLVSPILGGTAHGHALMVYVARTMKALATQYSICFIVTNFMASDFKGKRPALGMSWAGMPNVRLMLSPGEDAFVAVVHKTDVLKVTRLFAHFATLKRPLALTAHTRTRIFL